MPGLPEWFDLDQFRKRLIRDAMLEATAVYWLKRADALEKARPKESDFTGASSPAELAARDEALRVAAENCRNHARLIRRS